MASALEYLRLFQSLLPRGKMWTVDEGSILTEFLYGQAEEFARVDARSEVLLSERDVRVADELLPDHELDLGLPDTLCFVGTQTPAERRITAYNKQVFRGRQNKAYFIELADSFDVLIDIIFFVPAWCGVATCGDPCGENTNVFYWEIMVPFGTSSEVLCYLKKYKPTHTHLLFDYANYAFGPIVFSSAFSSAFTQIGQSAFSSAFDIYFGGGNFDFYEYSTAFDKG